ncbi:MAG: DeoR/GlpR family DNA-binding transcription regulator [Chitinophagaceae bacterium]
MPTASDSTALPKKERKELIRKQVNIHTRLMYAELARLVEVSEDTIRRDVNELAAEGALIKIKGGAMAAAYHAGDASQTYARDNKLRIAAKTVSLLKEDMTVLIGGGTTIREVIKQIPTSFRSTFITVNVLTAMELLDKPNIRTIMIGGQISAYSQMTVSGEVFEQLARIKADLCIIGTNAIDPVNGLTDSDWETVQVKKAMLKAASATAVLAISEKLNSSMPIQFAAMNEVNYLITELDPNAPVLQPYTAKGIRLL